MKKHQEKNATESQSNADYVSQQTIENPQTERPPEASNIQTSQGDAKVAELITDLQRTRADFENYRKQSDLQKSQAMAAAQLVTVQKFLPLIDDMERAISAYPEQLAPLAKNFTKLLKTLGLTAIDSSAGVEFNPDMHEAVSVDEGDGELEVITETLRPGYLYNGEVLRASMVKVGHASKNN